MKIKTTLINICCLTLLLVVGLPVAQETASGDHVKVRWLAPDTFRQGMRETVGFYFEVDPGWHVYWRNAGDSGAAPRFDMEAQGASLGPIEWPFPTRLRVEHLTNLGYSGNVAYLFQLLPDKGTQEVTLHADLEWLVCKVDCIPGFATMSLVRPVAEQAAWPATDLALRNYFANRLPGGQSESPWQPVSISARGSEHITLQLSGNRSDEIPSIFPVNGDLYSASEPEVQREDETLLYKFKRLPGSEVSESSDFVITDSSRAWKVSAPLLSQEGIETSATSIWLLLLSAFIAGILLNLMPCVFPVLSIKLFGLINGGNRPAERLRESFLYSAGIMVTFLALGLALLTLRWGGLAVGWGFQLQSPVVVIGLIMLFWLMALSFSGFFEFGHRLMGLASSNSRGSFTTGVLAVFVAAPCTGPFMGAALGAAVVIPPLQALLIFLCLALGLAAPFILMCASPVILRHLPAPGPWMEKLRQFLAFPLYATVIWLLWILGRLAGDSGWLAGLSLLLVVTLAIWLVKNFSKKGGAVGLICVAAILLISLPAIRMEGGEQPAEMAYDWHRYDKALLTEALDNGRPVFIDYTAAWCITCQVNKKLVLDTPSVQALFKKNNVLLIRADWTRYNPEITQALQDLGRNSVPVYAWYPAGEKKPELLPPLLQESLIAALFSKHLTVNSEDG
ncbi:protein-disulfide reductase DsbD family protein [Microbulbifer sp. SSSA008]|uniref:protein-disulfide reductase DsbD family protein n=1 Tax=Microbulbifer sp. SSSA008 TaxID=3243380 RepID=UPI004039736A